MPRSRGTSRADKGFGQGGVKLSHGEREKTPEWFNDETFGPRRGRSNTLTKGGHQMKQSPRGKRYGRRSSGKTTFGDMLNAPDRSKVNVKLIVGASSIQSNNSIARNGDPSSMHMSKCGHLSQQQCAPDTASAMVSAHTVTRTGSKSLLDYDSSSDDDAKQNPQNHSGSLDTQMADWYDFDFMDSSYDNDVTYIGLSSTMADAAEDASSTDSFRSAKEQASNGEAIETVEYIDQSNPTFVTPPPSTRFQPSVRRHRARGYSSASSTTMTGSTYIATPASTEPASGRATPDDTVDHLGKLPAELRLRIFSYVLLGGASHVPKARPGKRSNDSSHPTAIEQIDQDRFRPYCVSSEAWVPSNTPGNIGILGTCKQYHDEATAILYGQHIFSKSYASFAWIFREDKQMRSIFPFAKRYLPQLRRVELWFQETHGKSRTSEGTAAFLRGLAQFGMHLVKLTVFFAENNADKQQRSEQPPYRSEGETVVVTGSMTLKHPVIKGLVNLMAHNHVKNVEIFIEGEMMMGKDVLTIVHKAWLGSCLDQDRAFTVKAQHGPDHLRAFGWYVVEDLAECELFNHRKLETRVKTGVAQLN
ncbi:hypothetical protein LTS18_006989 [Coniosporium uncinatum]|uniref:Uncharacterized protein n=1 Tax=Coniosporium uncinatum TaxID=93489 RepID=A0ACC3DPU3_9PEZI|nr:hypothetical protein LTS18_006989 [Coniosporium uncinatum]